tara:strand:- start:539 stop:1705 length:1167 start_codon:yes stop_codon:yes gene_type:complete
MVFELKSSEADVPGVLIFSHKEYKLLFNKKSENKYLKKLKASFFIGVHWGASEDNVIKNELIDFHLSLPGLIPEKIIPSTEIVELTTRSFLSKDFKNNHLEKKYDIITIGRKVKAKRYLEFFLIIKEVMKKKPDLRVMVVAPEDQKPKKSTFDYLFEENFNEIFSESEKRNITVYSENKYLDKKEIIDLLNKSKIFLFTSIREGVAKVTGEAALCGLKILIFKNFRGNAIFGIDKKQYLLFENIDDCASKVLDMIEDKNLNVFDNKDLYEDESLNKLDNFLSELYRNNNYEFDGEYNSKNLMNNLNSFNNTLPKELVLGNSNDLRNNRAFLKYCISKNIKIKNMDYIFNYSLDLKLKVNEILRIWKNFIPLPIWKMYRRKNQYKKLFK